MKKKNRKAFVIAAMASLMFALSGCQETPNYCVVVGTVQNLPDGAEIELQDLWQDCKVVGTGVVKDGAFEIRPKVTGPAHVFLYQGDSQLQDFFLEPDTVYVSIDAAEGDEYGPGATGTPSNDVRYRYLTLKKEDRQEAAQALLDSVLAAGQPGPMALTYAESSPTAKQALEVLDRLSPDLAGLGFASELKEELTLRVKTEPRADYKPQFINLEYNDAGGKAVSLSSVVHNPQNRYVLLDFWATWCRPCVRYLPQMKELYAKYHGQGLEIYSVSLDTDASAWSSFVKENGMQWINVIGDYGRVRKSKIWESYGINPIPMFLLIDCNTGEIILRDQHPDLDAIISERIRH